MNRKVIRVTLTLRGFDKDGKPEVFTSEGNFNQITGTGLRVLVNILNGNGALSPTASIQIYGLAMDKMAKLMRVQWNTMQALMSTVKIEAGDEGKELTLVYSGNITFAKIDMSNAPNVFLNIESQSAVVEAMRPADATPFLENTDAAEMIKIIAEQRMGYRFENSGASKIIAEYSNYQGSYLDQIKTIANDAEFDLYIEQNLIAIAPKGAPRNIKIPIISPTSGLIGYPIPDIKGVSFRCFYDPNIRFGGIVRIQDSLIEVCNGDWRIYGVKIVLEANQSGGQWMMEVNASHRDSTDAAIRR